MARACSGDEDTVHYMHTMNWVRDIKGACHLDWILDARDVKQQAEVRQLRLDCSLVTGLYMLCTPVWQLSAGRQVAHS
jgi:hypothetical protein